MDTSTTAANDPQFEIPKVSRREFLYYLGGASLALAAAQTCSLVTWYTEPRIRYIEEEGYLHIDLDTVPVYRPFHSPIRVVLHLGEQGRIPSWLVRSDNSLVAFDGQCVYRWGEWERLRRGISLVWIRSDNRFECPHCGSNFTIDGTYMWGPAHRNLDRFELTANTANGTVVTPDDGSPISIEGATSVMLNVNQVIRGAPRIN